MSGRGGRGSKRGSGVQSNLSAKDLLSGFRRGKTRAYGRPKVGKGETTITPGTTLTAVTDTATKAPSAVLTSGGGGGGDSSNAEANGSGGSGGGGAVTANPELVLNISASGLFRLYLAG
jgi:hypothetical protein